MKTKTRARSTLKLIAIVALCSVLAGCGDGPTSPTTRTAPTPLPIPNVAGSWQGRYRAGTSSQFFNCGGDVAASATFSQDGSGVTGTVTAPSSSFVQAGFVGGLSGDQLHGTLTVAGTAKSVTGAASSSHMTMSFRSGSLFCGNSTIDLAR